MQFEIDPVDGLADQGLVVKLVDVGKGQQVTLDVATEDADGHRWTSRNQFVADDAGTIDLSRDAPARGSYFTMHPLGVITTMVPDDPASTSLFATADAGPMVLRLRAEAEYGDVVEATVTRRFQGDGVERRVVEAAPVHGTLFTPADAADAPAVLVVAGVVPAERAALPMAALLANRGYVTLALDLTDRPGLPDQLHEVPLEHIAAAAEWLRSQPAVDGGRVGAIGFGRGAEGLVAAACRLPELGLDALVAVAPSCVAWQSEDDPDASAWTLGGVPLPCGVVREGLGHRLLRKVTGREEELTATVDAYRAVLGDLDLLRVAGFPVDGLDTPLCLLSGGDDRQWPSAEMAELIYRTRRRPDGADQMVVYDKAGRLLRAPYVPAAGDRWIDPDGGGQLLGGDPEATRRADVQAWAKINEFLARHLAHDAETVLPVGGRPVDPEWPSQAEPPPEPDPEYDLARAIVRGVDVDVDRGATIRNPLPPPPTAE